MINACMSDVTSFLRIGHKELFRLLLYQYILFYFFEKG